MTADIVERLLGNALHMRDTKYPGAEDAANLLDDARAEIARLREIEREANEAMQLTESCSTLKGMAAACIEGAMWKYRAEAAEAALASARSLSSADITNCEEEEP